jgi:hypothetical protein
MAFLPDVIWFLKLLLRERLNRPPSAPVLPYQRGKVAPDLGAAIG